MRTHPKIQNPEPVSQLSLWIGMLGGATAWALHLAVGYALVPLACAQGLEILLYLVIPVTLGLAGLSIFFAWRGWDRTKDLPSENGNGDLLIVQRVRFMAISGLTMSIFFLVVIMAQSVPILANSPCDPAGSIRI